LQNPLHHACADAGPFDAARGSRRVERRIAAGEIIGAADVARL
jgi:hypothetical protein